MLGTMGCSLVTSESAGFSRGDCVGMGEEGLDLGAGSAACLATGPSHADIIRNQRLLMQANSSLHSSGWWT